MVAVIVTLGLAALAADTLPDTGGTELRVVEVALKLVVSVLCTGGASAAGAVDIFQDSRAGVTVAVLSALKMEDSTEVNETAFGPPSE